MEYDCPKTIAMKNLVLDILSDLKENFWRDALAGFEVIAREGQNPPCIILFKFLQTDLDELETVIAKFRENFPSPDETLIYSKEDMIIYQIRFNRETLANQGKESE